MTTVRIDVAPAFAPLLKSIRYKGAHGGRGGAKSHFFAEYLIARCVAHPTRAVCIREVQNSIRDSVRQLLVDKIQKLGVGELFEPLDAEIRGSNGSLIVFKGMQSYNAETIKSLEAYDIAWVEEAQTLSQKSLDLLRPTIRKEGSELWFSWNPRYRTDAVDAFFRKSSRDNALAIEVNWRDNPWFPDVLRKDMQDDRLEDPELAEHIWDGGYSVQPGAILARLIERAEKAGRITDDVRFDPECPGIEISSDIGFRDTATWWFWQRKPRGFSLLDYDADSGLDAPEWIVRLKERLELRGYPLRKIWLPHDARIKTFQSRHSALEQFLEAFGKSKVDIVPQSSKTDRINAARTIVKRCEFHKTNCEAGLDGLRAWEYEWNPETKTYSREPLHNWASHPGDGYSYGAQVMVEHVVVEEKKDPMRGIVVGQPSVTLNELWHDRTTRQRI